MLTTVLAGTPTGVAKPKFTGAPSSMALMLLEAAEKGEVVAAAPPKPKPKPEPKAETSPKFSGKLSFADDNSNPAGVTPSTTRSTRRPS